MSRRSSSTLCFSGLPLTDTYVEGAEAVAVSLTAAAPVGQMPPECQGAQRATDSLRAQDLEMPYPCVQAKLPMRRG